MTDKEKDLLKMYDGSLPDEDKLFDTSSVNHLAWSLFVIALGMVVWLGIALVNAENQRFALANGKCQDPLFKGAIEQRCLASVQSREHWWEHLWYGVTHLRPEQPK